MTDRRLQPNDRLEDEAVAYALGALEPAEASSFEARLATDPAARNALAEAVTGLDALSEVISPVDAPPALRDRILSAAAQPAPVPAASPGVVRSPSPAAVVPLAPHRPWYGRPAAWALAVAALAILALGGWNVQLRNVLDERDRLVATQTRQIQEQADELASRDRVVRAIGSGERVVALAPGAGNRPVGSVIVPGSQQPALLVPGDLPAIGPNQVYQIWIVRGSEPVSAGVFQQPGAAVPLTTPLQPGDTVAITIEPGPTGSPRPTSPPFASAPV